MKIIYKYEIEITDRQEIVAPAGAVPLHAGLDPYGVPCVWLQVDSMNEKRPYSVFVVGTGHPIPDDATLFVGTIVKGPFVWHVFFA